MTLDIHLGVIILWAITALCGWAAIKLFRDWETFGGLVMLGIGSAFAAWGFHEADPQTAIYRAEEARANHAREEAYKQPRVIREADGCKVYAFKSGERWHYFTRCPNAHTVTDTSYEQCSGSGKSRRCEEVHSSIETR